MVIWMMTGDLSSVVWCLIVDSGPEFYKDMDIL